MRRNGIFTGLVVLWIVVTAAMARAEPPWGPAAAPILETSGFSEDGGVLFLDDPPGESGTQEGAGSLVPVMVDDEPTTLTEKVFRPLFRSDGNVEDRCWQILPDGLLYRSYLAGPKEPRFAAVWLHETSRGWIWETALGGRVGVVRYGTPCAAGTEGWQLDLEGGVFPRLDLENQDDLDAADFRFGVPLTWRRGPLAVKFGYYHISAHVGDEFLVRNPGFQRINYVRESLILGVSRHLTEDVRVYGEVGWAFARSGGARPFEFQFGGEYSPAEPATGLRPAPFAAVNVHLREEAGFGGGVNVVAGWQWRGAESGRRFRIGGQYYNGKSLQFSFFDHHEELAGFGAWFDY